MQALVESARRKGSALVAGMDPIPARFPRSIKDRDLPPHEAVREFCTAIIAAVEPLVAAVKLQAAYFERLGPAGMEVYGDLIRTATELGLPTIADVKRGDVGPVSAAYAEAHLSVYGATCVTVNPYMGSDSVLPFLQEVRRQDRGGGVFVLVATSNPSAASFQEAHIPPPYETASRLVRDVGLYSSTSGYPDAGAVVGVTRPEAAHVVRTLLPDQIFLAPGYGAQGGTADDVQALLDSGGSGVLVNSSRAILYAYEAEPETPYPDAARAVAARTRDALIGAGVRW
jgi:orotidine-5'-phosphate decarboxylase